MATSVELPPGPLGAPTAYVDTDVRFGEDVVVPRFQERLETYYDKAPLQDRSRCLELITSLEVAKHLRGQARPHTAMAAVTTKVNLKDPYLTTYTYAYPRKPGCSSDTATRPKTATTSCRYHFNATAPLGTSTYTESYVGHRDAGPPPSPIRSGTASLARNNKPHPSQAFMVWKLPANSHDSKIEQMRQEGMTNERLNQITRRLFRSTYQYDYLGLPQGFQTHDAFGDSPPDPYWKDKVPYSTESIQRQSYLRPKEQPPVLRVPTNRYGSNIERARGPAVGTSPTINRVLLDLKTRTTYDRHFNDLAPSNVQQVRELGRRQYEEAMQRHFKPPPPRNAAPDEADSKGDNCRELKLGGGRQTIFASVPPPDDADRMPDHISDWPGPL